MLEWVRGIQVHIVDWTIILQQVSKIKKTIFFYISTVYGKNYFSKILYCKPWGCFFPSLFFLPWMKGTDRKHLPFSVTGPLRSVSAASALIVLLRVHFCLFWELWPAKIPLQHPLPYITLKPPLFSFFLFADYSWNETSGFVQIIKKTTHKRNNKNQF